MLGPLKPSLHAIISKIFYDYLVVAPGIQIDWHKIRGLKESLGSQSITSNYDVDCVEKTSEFIRAFNGGTALFTQPSTAIKCAGAPQKIMYLAEEQWKNRGLCTENQTSISFHTGMGKLFAVDKYAKTLTDICRDRSINVVTESNLVEVLPDEKIGSHFGAHFFSSTTLQLFLPLNQVSCRCAFHLTFCM